MFIRLGRMKKMKIISNKVTGFDYTGDGYNLGNLTVQRRDRYPGEVWHMAL